MGEQGSKQTLGTRSLVKGLAHFLNHKIKDRPRFRHMVQPCQIASEVGQQRKRKQKLDRRRQP